MPENTFDQSYFIDPATGKFCFPAYTTNWKGLVQVRDLTAYKKQCLADLSGDAIANFSLKQFEATKLASQFKVESLEDFIERFPASCFEEGISSNNLIFILSLFSEYCEDDREAEEDEYLVLEPDEMEEGIAAGLLIKIDVSNFDDPHNHWALFPENEIYEACLDHQIIPGSSTRKTIQKLVEHKIYNPGTVVGPTPLLREIYHSFIKMYMYELKKSTGHFHPKLLPALWTAVGESSWDWSMRARVKQILKSPYWKPAKGIASTGEPETEPVSFSNAVFSFATPNPSTNIEFVREPLDPNDVPHPNSYSKAKDGSFDEKQFQREGRFSFPDYVSTHKGLVFVDDKTNYKKKYLAGLSSEQINDFSLADLERNFVRPEWEVRPFDEFVEDLAADQLPAGITGTRLRELLLTCWRFSRTFGKDEDSDYAVMDQNDPFVVQEFFEKADRQFINQARAWDTVPLAALREISVENGIKPARNKVTMIWDLINANIYFPVIFYSPTNKFNEYYESLQRLYVKDVLESTDYFHPLYFESLWEEIIDINSDDEIIKEVNAILANPYWNDRLYLTGK